MLPRSLDKRKEEVDQRREEEERKAAEKAEAKRQATKEPQRVEIEMQQKGEECRARRRRWNRMICN